MTPTRAHEHLEIHRSLILSRAIVAGAAGLVPVPLLDDWITATIRRGTLRRIANARRVDVDRDALRHLADGATGSPSWRSVAGSLALIRLLRGTVRRMFVAWAVGKRADEAARAFAAATLFDHYCARLHVGAGLDLARGRAVRGAIEHALGSVRSGVGTRLFKRGLSMGARTALSFPRELGDLLTGGRLRALFGRGRRGGAHDEAAAEELAEGAVDQAVADAMATGGPFARTTRAIERELMNAGRGWVDDLVTAFERRLYERS